MQYGGLIRHEKRFILSFFYSEMRVTVDQVTNLIRKIYPTMIVQNHFVVVIFAKY
jgi:DNA primase large subunit